MSQISQEITLYCLIHGEDAAHSFDVKISKSDDVMNLKRLIKAANPDTLNDVKEAQQLTLWKVEIPLNELAKLEPGADIQKFNPELLMPPALISTVFSSVLKEHIHVIVKRPTILSPSGKYQSK